MRSRSRKALGARFVQATCGLFVALMLASAPALGQSSFPGSVTPNPAPYGVSVQFGFFAGVLDCDYDVALRTVGRAGNVVLVTFDLVPRPPIYICFATPPPLFSAVNLGVLPPGEYIARAQGTLDGVALPPVVVPFRVLGVTSQSVPAMSRWTQAVLALIVLAIAFDMLRRGRSA